MDCGFVAYFGCALAYPGVATYSSPVYHVGPCPDPYPYRGLYPCLCLYLYHDPYPYLFPYPGLGPAHGTPRYDCASGSGAAPPVVGRPRPESAGPCPSHPSELRGMPWPPFRACAPPRACAPRAPRASPTPCAAAWTATGCGDHGHGHGPGRDPCPGRRGDRGHGSGCVGAREIVPPLPLSDRSGRSDRPRASPGSGCGCDGLCLGAGGCRPAGCASRSARVGRCGLLACRASGSSPGAAAVSGRAICCVPDGASGFSPTLAPVSGCGLCRHVWAESAIGRVASWSGCGLVGARSTGDRGGSYPCFSLVVYRRLCRLCGRRCGSLGGHRAVQKNPLCRGVSWNRH